MMETEFRLTVNGSERSVTCEPDTPLLDVLRLELGLAGPKFGCGMGLCGACFVLVEGRARASCELAVSAVGGPVTTVEGLPDGGWFHPVQQAFVDEQAAQCGYCTSGMVMAAAGLLRDHPAPAEQEVREALDGNLCRCGTHGRISTTRRSPRAPPAPSSTRTPAPCSAPTADDRADGWCG
jgi:nicotinate dehydrogenase subunit A